MKAALIGLGTMGPGIAATLARAGWETTAYDAARAQREAAPRLIAAADGVLQQIQGDDSPAASVRIVEDLADCVQDAALVIENVPERLELKREVFASIAGLVGADCILASDTSGIPITDIQQDVPHPGRVVGMHWSNPPHIIPMIEVIAGAQTDPATVEWTAQVVRDLKMLPIIVRKDVPGFVENRILYSVMREAVDLVEQGVISPEDLDACVGWGIGYKLAVIGPMSLLDMAGLDIYRSVAGYLNADLSARKDVSAFITAKTDQGRLGLKTGSGVFDYAPDDIQRLRKSRIDKLVNVRRALEL